MIRFVIIAITTIASVALGSLAWPKLTSQPRPQPLQAVHDAVLKTQVGEQAAQILSVTDEANVKPVNLAAEVASVGSSIVTGIEQRAAGMLSNQAAAVMINQYKQLPPQARQELQQAICKP